MRPIPALFLSAALAFAPLAHARQAVTDPALPRGLSSDGPVTVEWTDPAQFSEIRLSHNRWEAVQGAWVTRLAEHLQQRATERLPDGQRMDVTITDIQRAGSFEPQVGTNYQHVRIMRDIYPPRMTLQVRVTGADGQVLAEGERKLVDMAYLHNTPRLDSDNLRYEKRMIDDWLRRELPSATAQASR